MPGTDDTATATDESPRTTSDRDAPASFGTAEVALDVSPETYDRLFELPTAKALSLTHKFTESQTDVSDAVEPDL